MARIDFTFQDEAGTNLNRFKATREDDNTSYYVTLTREANIQIQGTPIDAQHMNEIINAINDMYQTSVTGVKGESESTYRIGNVNITKANIGLGNVDNIADKNKIVRQANYAKQMIAIYGGYPINIGSPTQPVYFENGEPVACDSGFSSLWNCGKYVNKYSPEIELTTNKFFQFNVPYLGSKSEPIFIIFEFVNSTSEVLTQMCLLNTIKEQRYSIRMDFVGSESISLIATNYSTSGSIPYVEMKVTNTTNYIKRLKSITAIYLRDIVQA